MNLNPTLPDADLACTIVKRDHREVRIGCEPECRNPPSSPWHGLAVAAGHSYYRTMCRVIAGRLTTLYIHSRLKDDTPLVGGEAPVRNSLTSAESTRRIFCNNYES